jgi:hypothetical protein
LLAKDTLIFNKKSRGNLTLLRLTTLSSISQIRNSILQMGMPQTL